MVLRHGRTCSQKKVEQLHKVSHPCLDDHQFKKEALESVGDFSEVGSQIVLQCLYLARIGRPDILWSVNKLARSVTQWTQAYNKREARLISFIYPSHKWLYFGSLECAVEKRERSLNPFRQESDGVI